MQWQPTASLAMQAARAALNARLRRFFAERGVHEVETPLLCHASGTDPNLQPITAVYQDFPQAASQTLYLQTSPEFAMKRLLAAGSGPIFQLCKAFRNGESGGRHNPEFTVLEWYRPGFSLAQLMDEVEALVLSVLPSLSTAVERVNYRQLFQQRLAIDPHTVPLAELRALTLQQVPVAASVLNSRAVCLDLLYGHVIEPTLLTPVFIYHYPAEQAALAKVVNDELGQPVALRFELVVQGMELANGYDELLDAAEQARRCAADQQLRQQQQLPLIAADQRLLAALAAGLPACAGVALGVDRLLMLQTGAKHIDDVLTFPLARA
jgi:elongation factor P--(R)-beta-lysine ligase